jgi:hypothetical protein
MTAGRVHVTNRVTPPGSEAATLPPEPDARGVGGGALFSAAVRRVALTRGCHSIGYTDHTGCY